MSARRARDRTALPLALVVAGVVVAASAGCRQIFGLEEPAETTGGGGGTATSSTGAGDPCLAMSKELVTLTDVGPPGKTLGCDKDYVLAQDVSVLDGAALTIEPGTTLRAKANVRLIVAPGGKLLADGTADRPIVFTSDENVPWGGIELRGRAPGVGSICAPGNPFVFATPGDPSDSSGVLRYVRLDRGGSQATSCTGSLILIGVGSGTVLDQIDIPLSASDAVSIAGGTPRLKHLVVTDPADDGIDLENGADAKVQFFVYRGVATAGCPSNDTCPNAIDADGDDAYGATVDVRNATLCGHQTKAPANTALTSVQGAMVTVQRSILSDHSAALNVVGTSDALLETSVLFDDSDPGLDEVGLGDDDGYDEGQFALPAHKNTVVTMPPIQCFGAVNLVPDGEKGNPGSLGSGAFFEDAAYTGALTAADTWMSWIAFP